MAWAADKSRFPFGINGLENEKSGACPGFTGLRVCGFPSDLRVAVMARSGFAAPRTDWTALVLDSH
jgi:hypothetical protein